MSIYRIVNPALEPPRVEVECGDDEQAALREYVKRDASAHGLQLQKSDDEGKTWESIEARAPDGAAAKSHHADDEELARAVNKRMTSEDSGEADRPSGGKKAK